MYIYIYIYIYISCYPLLSAGLAGASGTVDEPAASTSELPNDTQVQMAFGGAADLCVPSPMPTVEDIVVRGANCFVPGREHSIGRITKWHIGEPTEQISAVCHWHSGCRRMYSKSQLQRYGIDGTRDLMEWLLLPFCPGGLDKLHHGCKPKPLHPKPSVQIGGSSSSSSGALPSVSAA